MLKYIHKIYHKALVFLHLSPLSLAKKCRIAFGGAVVFILMVALSILYFWMGKLTTKASLDTNRAKTETLFRNHFKLTTADKTAIAVLDNTGTEADVNNPQIRWIRFSKADPKLLQTLSIKQKDLIELLKAEKDREDDIFFEKKDGSMVSNYVRIFRANDSCIRCHNAEGSASAFSLNEPVGAAIIQRPAFEVRKIILLNRAWVLFAGLIAGTGAIVAFYIITQRVILHPIRQLRAIANNVAEGNLDIRSSIKTRDEYEKLANAFNHMLDGLQAAQEKLRQANKKLDAKIAELSERNIELFKANQIKSEFLANISHEFRTPLNAILGFAEILREKTGILQREKSKRYAENIITSGKRLLAMINDLLDLAKTQAGKMQLHIEKTSISELLRSLVASFSPLTKKKKIKVKLKVDENIPDAYTDAGKVQQIIYNFLSNAVQFTDQNGRIEVSADMTDAKTILIAVRDTGCGFAESDKAKIFEKFRQVDGSITRQSAGSGLGLAICRELASMIAGSVDAESQIGKGSIFFLDIPINLAKGDDDK